MSTFTYIPFFQIDAKKGISGKKLNVKIHISHDICH